MNDTLIINGITYKAVKEEKKPERMERFVDKYETEITGVGLVNNAFKSKPKYRDTTRMVEIRSGEIIVSEDDVRNAIRNVLLIGTNYENEIIKELGFKKDGAE